MSSGSPCSLTYSTKSGPTFCAAPILQIERLIVGAAVRIDGHGNPETAREAREPIVDDLPTALLVTIVPRRAARTARTASSVAAAGATARCVIQRDGAAVRDDAIDELHWSGVERDALVAPTERPRDPASGRRAMIRSITLSS